MNIIKLIKMNQVLWWYVFIIRILQLNLLWAVSVVNTYVRTAQEGTVGKKLNGLFAN